MNDGVMYTFDVIAHHSHGISILYRCARRETADYLRDWCDAEEIDTYHNHRQKLLNLGVNTIIVDRMRNGLEKYSVAESEVIL